MSTNEETLDEGFEGLPEGLFEDVPEVVPSLPSTPSEVDEPDFVERSPPPTPIVVPSWIQLSPQINVIFSQHCSLNWCPDLEIFNLRSDDPNLYKFKEHLLIVNEFHEVLGDMHIEVAPISKFYYEVLISAEHLTDDKQDIQLSIKSLVDMNLNTLYECYVQSVFSDLGGVKNTLEVVRHRDTYSVKACSITGETSDEPVEKRFAREDMENYIGDGANILLLRKVSKLKKYYGCLSNCKYIHVSGTPLIISYVFKKPKIKKVNAQELNIRKVMKITNFPKQLRIISYAYLTYYGQLVKMIWSNDETRVIIHPDAVISETQMNHPELLVPLSKLVKFSPHLMTLVRDQVTRLKYNGHRYLFIHPEIDDILSDFLCHVFISRPESIIKSTIKYFSRY